MSETALDALKRRANIALARFGKGHHYAGLGLWCNGLLMTDRLHIVDNDDGFGIGLMSPPRSVLWESKHPTVNSSVDETLFPTAMNEIDRLLVMDDLADV